ncbi:MAG: phosphoribosyl-AMP cyclohydrolase [Paracoccaceae bacterium]
MLAWMNADAVARTPQRQGHLLVTVARGPLGQGRNSGHVQRLVEMRLDCDRDCLLVLVEQTGRPAITTWRSCFFTAVRDGEESELMVPEG